MASPPPAPPPPPPPPPPRSSSPQVPETLPSPPRLPRLEDFPEAGPNALATFQQRGLARVIDEAILVLPLFYVELPLVLAIAVFTGQLLYEIVAIALFGQTVGKLVMGIRVARYTDGGKPKWTQSSLRCLLWAAPASLALVLLHHPMIGALPVFLTAWRGPLRRGLHDESGGSIVVRTR